MMSRVPASTGMTLLLGLALTGCATRVPTPSQAPAPTPVVMALAPVPTPAPSPQADPVVELIAISTLHFEAGERELQFGHLTAAKTAFNRADRKSTRLK